MILGFFSQDSNVSICRVNGGSYAYSLFARERLNGNLSKILIYKGVSENKQSDVEIFILTACMHGTCQTSTHTFGPPWHQGLYPIIEKIGVKYLN